jgi:predicted CopG family antitoxin
VSALFDLIQLTKNNKKELQRQKQEKNSFSRDVMVTQLKNVKKAYLSTQTKYVGQKRKFNFDDLTFKQKRTY